MASHRTQPSRGRRAIGRAAATIAAGCCVAGLSALPTAQAAKTTTSTSTTSSAVEVATTPHGKRLEREAQAAESAPAPVVAPPSAPLAGEQPVVGHAKHGKSPAAPVGGAVPAAGGSTGTGSTSAPSPRRLEREATPTRSRRGREPAPPSENVAGQGDQVAVASGDASRSSIEPLARKQKKEKEKTKKEKGSEKGKKKKEEGKKGTTGEEAGENPGQTSGQGGGKGKRETERESVDGASSEGTGRDEPTASAASVLAPAPSPAGGTGEASITSFVPPASVGVRTQRVAQGPRRHSRTRARGAAAAVAATSVATPAALTSLSAGATAPSPPLKPATKHKQAAAAQPAIVRSITHIVGVVPTPVRILIVALIALALALGVRSRLSSVRTRKLERQRGQLLEDVGLLQAALLPVPPARLGPVGTTVSYRPADGPGAGGDFYDVFALDDGRLAVIVGDVSGHGREALPHTALVRFTVRAYLEAGLSPRKALQMAGGVLDRQLAGSFATVVVAVYHPRERTLTYSSAGHPPPLVLGDPREGADRGEDDDRAYSVVRLTTACSAPPLGTGMHTGTRETVISVPGPARLCFHTDGVTEARVAGDLFGSERLTVALGELGREATAAALLDSVAERTDARPDDMAACVLRIEDGEGAAVLQREQLELDGAAIADGRAERFLRESGMSAEAAASTLDGARGELDRRDSVLLELSLGDGPPTATLEHEDLLHAAPLALASAS